MDMHGNQDLELVWVHVRPEYRGVAVRIIAASTHASTTSNNCPGFDLTVGAQDRRLTDA
jgi:hypothetical protein